VANASTPEELATAEAARDAGLACLALLAEKLLESANVSLSTTSAWFMHAGQQSVAENRWRHLIEITLAVQELPAA
jgi:hypothetical protein